MRLNRRNSFAFSSLMLALIWGCSSQPWYRVDMNVDGKVTELAKFSGLQAWPSLSSSLLVLLAALVVSLLSSKKFQRIIFALQGLFTLFVLSAIVFPGLQTSSENAPSAILGEIEKLTGIAQQHGLSGVELQLSFWPSATLVSLFGYFALLGAIFMVQPKWPNPTKRYAPTEETAEDTISLWESQRKKKS